MSYLQFDHSRPFDVVPIGRAGIDFNPIDYFKPLPECTTFKRYLGGSPANIAVGLARLGKKVGFIGCISDDQLGDFIEQYFKKEGIDTSRLFRTKKGESLCLAITEILSESESRLVMYRNGVADLQLSVEMIDEEYIKNTKMIVVSGTALSASPSREAALKAVELARKNGTVVVFDIDYRPHTWKNSDEISLYYTFAARGADIIMGSREEFDLTDGLLYKNSDDRETADRWLNENAKIVVIKHGKQGSTAYTKDGKSYDIKPFPVKSLKSFGGGDGYGSAFLFGLLEGWDIVDCLELGSASASMLVASHGCSDDMPTLDEIRKFIKEKKETFGDMIARK
ncbi:MAG: 5-dehydro-2-deoxygluconokinase [Thermoanaerobacteraceae bacterium]|nr:5-dehydro-2-deoxygluconokinase [Thermoanaerobacteraceae bacterium]